MREDPTDTPLQPRDANACARISLASRLLPKSATADAGWLILTRALRALGDGAVSILLVSYLQGIGFSAFDVGAIVTGLYWGRRR